MNFCFLFLFFTLSVKCKRLWKFLDPSEKVISKGYNFTGMYSHQFSADNHPGARYDGCMVYSRNSIFLFGGRGFDQHSGEVNVLGDTWQYSLSKGMWRWIDRIDEASEHSIPTTYGVYLSNFNHPGARSGHECVHYNGGMWTFGGIHDGRMRGDVWVFNTTTFQWRFVDVTGDRYTAEEIVLARYGHKSWKFKSYHPGGRTGQCLALYKDSFLMYGGYGFSGDRVNGWLSETWMFNMTVEKWQFFETGSSSKMASNSKIDDEEEYPGSRDQLGCWAHKGHFYLYSGRGYGVRESDCWDLNIETRKWHYLGRNKDLKVASEMGPMHKLKYSEWAVPGIREDFARFQMGGYFYTYGGWGKSSRGLEGYLGDLWIYSTQKEMWKWIDTVGDKRIQKTENYIERYHDEEEDSHRFNETVHPGTRRAMFFASNPAKDQFYIFGGQNIKGIKGDLWVLGFSCFGKASDDIEHVCSGHGKCIRENNCKCDEGYQSTPDCSEKQQEKEEHPIDEL